MKILSAVSAILMLMIFCLTVHAQVGIGTTTPNPKSVLDLKSPGNDQGFLVPRLTTGQRNAMDLSSADNGLMVYDSDERKFYYWDSTQWMPLKSGTEANLAAGTGIKISNDTISAIADGDGNSANEIQDLALTANTLKITNNASASNIDLTRFIDDDSVATNEIQDLELTGNTLKITNNASATAIDLSTYIDGDGDASNEIQDLQLVGATLSITNNASATAIDLAPFTGVNTDNQTLSFTSSTGELSITGGNAVTVTATGAAGGDLSGTYPNPTIADNAISTTKIIPSTTGGEVLTTVDGETQWAALPASVTNIATGTGLTGGPVTSTGTIGIASEGVTTTEIKDGTISNADIDASAAISVSKLAAGGAGQVLTTSGGGAPAWAAVPDNSSSNELQSLDGVLSRGNDAKGQEAYGFKTLSVNWDIKTYHGALNVNGSHFVSFTTIADDGSQYTVKDNDYLIIVKSGSGKGAGIILPKASENTGRILIIRTRTTTDAVVVKSTEGLDGSATSENLVYSQGNAYSLTVISTGTDWITINRAVAPAPKG